MPDEPPLPSARSPVRLLQSPRDRGQWLSGLLGLAEDLVYAITGLLLLAASLFALGSSATRLLAALAGQEATGAAVVGVLDQLLLVLIFVELFYTIRLSIREHILAVEPFIAVALIATVRRILVLTAEEQRVLQGEAEAFRRLVIELGLLAGLILVLVVAMLLLRRINGPGRSHATEAG